MLIRLFLYLLHLVTRVIHHIESILELFYEQEGIHVPVFNGHFQCPDGHGDEVSQTAVSVLLDKSANRVLP